MGLGQSGSRRQRGREESWWQPPTGKSLNAAAKVLAAIWSTERIVVVSLGDRVTVDGVGEYFDNDH